MTRRAKANQSKIKYNVDTVVKRYRNTVVNKMSSLENEMYHLNLFKDSPHCIKVIQPTENGYEMERLSFSLGSPGKMFEENVRRMLLTIPGEEVLKQLSTIQNTLSEKGIKHRDINPGNILFSEKEKLLKLTDFYWAISKNHKVGTPAGLNGIYGRRDGDAFKRIREEFKIIDSHVRKKVRNTKKFISNRMGQKYYDGSAKRRGKTYHVIDIPYFQNTPYHRKIQQEAKVVLNSVTGKVERVMDVGCSSGYYLFNLIRNHHIKQAIGYEADPIMNKVLKNIVKIFLMESLSIENKITKNTVFPSKIDVTICMNIHMWLYKQLGKDSDIVLSNLIKRSRQLFFQTAGLESNGMFLDKRMKNKEAIKKYLENLGGKKVSFIHTTNMHGGKRHLFKIGE